MVVSGLLLLSFINFKNFFFPSYMKLRYFMLLQYKILMVFQILNEQYSEKLKIQLQV